MTFDDLQQRAKQVDLRIIKLRADNYLLADKHGHVIAADPLPMTLTEIENWLAANRFPDNRKMED
ncbi:MAG: hypothetical protein IKD80_06340 [Selenomonadaceae bacterium]|nr:hypothetical protein [Selenomonadaceae bacterium]